MPLEKAMEPPSNSHNNQMVTVYEEYYNRYKPLVLSRTYKRLSNYQIASLRQEAEDLCQDTFQGAYRWMRNFYEEHGEFPEEQVFVRVLKTIEINEYRSYLKHRRYSRTPAGAKNQILDIRNAHPDSSSSFQCPERNPEEALLWREYEAKIVQCLGKLKATESAALLLKLIGHSDRQVADLMGEPEKKVMFTIIPWGRKKLRKCMEGYLNGHRPQ